MKILYWIAAGMLMGCSAKEQSLVQIEGKTMGTTYHISYKPVQQESSDMKDGPSKMKAEIDSLLVAFNNSVSTYIPTSTISRVNGPDTLIEVDNYFTSVFKRAREVSDNTGGAFDVTVMPLVNGWGFGYTDTIRMDSAIVDSLRQLVDYHRVNLSEADGKYMVHKADKRIQVDFSAIAKGYGVDVVALLLEQKGIENYMVEIGGEVRARGKNGKNQPWEIGVEKPVDDPGPGAHELKGILKLENKSLATSGNYRNFYYKNGKKVSHEIDPKTGYPAQNNLLSVTVIAGDCMTADAYATAFMVMGLEKTLAYLQQDTTLNAYLVYADDNGEMKTTHTKAVAGMLLKQN
jgi:thiamine biosynthesis lipoprotein